MQSPMYRGCRYQRSLTTAPGWAITVAGIAASLPDVTVAEHGIVKVYRLTPGTGAQHRSTPHGRGIVEHVLMTLGQATVRRAGE
ncbi:hypothetical protein MUBE_01225 [Mycobacterium uberis]|uniref:Uncharacterized protein n=2 Tax=Mycobacterium uberis TaxID=2162698 RepID=A0A3E1HL78_9MYCO|nr:hypothetical protein MUBE_01225 [Mycobacterium uberis]